jgi:hypothetical protein
VYLHAILPNARLQSLGGVKRDDLAAVDDGDAVAILRLVHVVSGEEDRDVLFRRER